MRPRDRLPQPVFVISSGILHTHPMHMQLYVPMCIPPSEAPLIRREYLPVIEVSGEFPGNDAFHELSDGGLY